MISPDYFARAGSSGIRTAMEREDDLVHDVYEYLSNQKYPKGASFNRKRTIRKKVQKNAISKEGELLYKHHLKGKVRV